MQHKFDAAIKTICEITKFKKSSTELALSTVQFVKKIDKIFDCLNSGSLYSDNCYRSVIQLNSEAFIYFLEYLESVKFVDHKKHVFFLNGMKFTINSVVMLITEILKKVSDVYFLMTNWKTLYLYCAQKGAIITITTRL